MITILHHGFDVSCAMSRLFDESIRSVAMSRDILMLHELRCGMSRVLDELRCGMSRVLDELICGMSRVLHELIHLVNYMRRSNEFLHHMCDITSYTTRFDEFLYDTNSIS